MRLRGKVAVVTGASRGAGRGIARALGAEGATVYVTGRTTRAGGGPTGRPETIEDTAEEVTARGGTGIAVRTDHSDDAPVAALFAQVAAEQGRLDVLVSNAWGGYEKRVRVEPFWDHDFTHLDLMYTAGLRAHLLTVHHAAALLRQTRGGLVALTTWAVGRHAGLTPQSEVPPYHGHLYYDVVKTGINRIPVGLADDFAPYGVTAVAVSPGWMNTESMDHLTPEQADRLETPEFVGAAVAALAADPDPSRHNGRLRTVVELARDYGFTDVNGRPSSEFWDELARGRDIARTP